MVTYSYNVFNMNDIAVAGFRYMDEAVIFAKELSQNVSSLIRIFDKDGDLLEQWHSGYLVVNTRREHE